MIHRLTHLLSCKEASRLLSQAQDRPLALGERVKLRLHLAVCRACTRFARQLALMRGGLLGHRSDGSRASKAAGLRDDLGLSRAGRGSRRHGGVDW